jgi:hypothetical protein
MRGIYNGMGDRAAGAANFEESMPDGGSSGGELSTLCLHHSPRVLFVVDDATVGEADDPVAAMGDGGIVGDHQDGFALRHQFIEEGQYLLPGFGI